MQIGLPWLLHCHCLKALVMLHKDQFCLFPSPDFFRNTIDSTGQMNRSLVKVTEIQINKYLVWLEVLFSEKDARIFVFRAHSSDKK